MCDGGSSRPRPEVSGRDSLCCWNMKSKPGAAARSGGECDAAVLRLHDPFDEVQPQTVSWNVGFDVGAPIEGLKEMTFVRIIDTRAVIGYAEPDLVGGAVFFCRDLDLCLAAGLPILQRVTQKILDTLCQSRGVGLNRRQVR